MTWLIHSLGSLDLIFTTPTASSYFVDRQDGDIDWDTTDEYVENRESSGARLVYTSEGKGDLQLDIMCIGSTRDAADANRDALEDQVNAAKSGDLVTYVEQDSLAGAPTSLKVIGGKLRRVSALPGRAVPFSLSGQFVSCAILTLALSKS